jgi:hypothetical protein
MISRVSATGEESGTCAGTTRASAAVIVPTPHRFRLPIILALGVAAACGDDPTRCSSPTQLTLSGPGWLGVHACAEFTVRRSVIADELGHAVQLEIASMQGITVHHDDACSQPATSIELAQGRADVTFWVRGELAGAGELVVETSDKDGAARHALTVFALGFPDRQRSGATLVVYNRNQPGARALAEHYAAARGIATERLCEIAVPPGLFGTREDIAVARRTILHDCICATVPASVRPQPCDDSTLSEIAEHSPISHLAIVRGIPARLYDPAITGREDYASFDFVLAAQLYHPPSAGGSSYLYAAAPDGTMPALAARQHRIVAYGRIEGMTHERTLALIDRTLEAERQGLSGNFFTSGDHARLADLTAGYAPECTAYLTRSPFVAGDPESTWPASCRWGSTKTAVPGAIPGGIPGTAATTIPTAVQAGLFLGTDFIHNSQAGFACYRNQPHDPVCDGFQTLLNWRKTAAACVPLCRDLGTAAERSACRASSTDALGELNTDCVGAAPGLVGHQVRSYVVQYMGFMPAGWGTEEVGSAAKTAPLILEGDGFVNERFIDTRYAHFGAHSVTDLDDSTCPSADGGPTRACTEKLPFILFTDFPVALSPRTSGAHELVVRLRYRTQGTTEPQGSHLTVELRLDNQVTAPAWATVPASTPALQWQTAERTFTADGTQPFTTARLVIYQGLHYAPRGFLDLDAIEVIDTATGDNLLPTDVGSFTRPLEETQPGDWAAQAIERLGAVAWWGSASHYGTLGTAFANAASFLRAFVGGRTLGEGLLATGNPHSGIIYGDPLYRPSAVGLHAPDWPNQLSAPTAPTVYLFADTLADYPGVAITALHGTGHHHDVRWTLAHCAEDAPRHCSEASYATFAEGVGTAERLVIDIASAFEAQSTSSRVFRVRAENPRTGAAAALTQTQRIRYFAFPRPCVDLDGDGYSNGVDLERVLAARPCTADQLAVDYDGDGDVDADDEAIFLQLWAAKDPRADVNNDGVVNLHDFNAFSGLGQCGVPVEGADVDGSGLVDQEDVDLVRATLGVCPAT